MKIQEICDRGLFTETDRRFFEALADREFERLIEQVYIRFGKEFPSPSIADELERRRRQRRNKRVHPSGAGGIGSPPSEVAAAPAADAPAADAGGGAAAPIGMAGPMVA
jgi:hypothetical protein